MTVVIRLSPEGRRIPDFSGMTRVGIRGDLPRLLSSDAGGEMWIDRLRAALRGALGIHPTLDLHGLGVREALAATEAFLRQAQEENVNPVRIVYGKGRGSPGGRGVLREVIPRWLDEGGAGMVERYERRPDHSGADGAVVVWLLRPSGG